jgi:hypothetical protein
MLELYHFDAHQSDWIEGFSFKFCCFSQYPSRTLFEDATAELVGDLIWDEEYRLKWSNSIRRLDVHQKSIAADVALRHVSPHLKK